MGDRGQAAAGSAAAGLHRMQRDLTFRQRAQLLEDPPPYLRSFGGIGGVDMIIVVELDASVAALIFRQLNRRTRLHNARDVSPRMILLQSGRIPPLIRHSPPITRRWLPKLQQLAAQTRLLGAALTAATRDGILRPPRAGVCLMGSGSSRPLFSTLR